MCGITGFLDVQKGFCASSGDALVRRMARAIAHRGPDGEGTFVDPECGLAFGHRRLSIIDLSEAGSQPMFSSDRRWVITYNGEIYNFEEMRCVLETRFGPQDWRGHSDTEVLIEAIARLGFEDALRLANGMFAIAAWDRDERALYLARDRMGEKPLYYGWQGKSFLFGSELKALAVHPEFSRRIDPRALALFVRYGYVPSPLCIYQQLAQLRPGHYVKLSKSARGGEMPEPRAYWTLPQPSPGAMDETSAVEELDRLLGDAVRLRMRADVPMGAFLSGGIDSSTVVGLMQAKSNVAVRSYSIGFHEDAYNEAKFASEVARHLGSIHTEMYVGPQDALDIIPGIPQIYDEPFADSSQIPTHLLCKLTRQHVTVALSGDGGDELFGGYRRYWKVERRWSRRLKGVDLLRPYAASLINCVPSSFWEFMRDAAPANLQKKFSPGKISRGVDAIRAATLREFYVHWMQQWSSNMLARPRPVDGDVFLEQHDIGAFPYPFLAMMYIDAGSYLPDDILVKVDRASMAVSLETRVPMLDHRVVEFAAKLPVDLKRRDDVGKWLLRRVLDRYVPQSLIDRPKQGFGVPIDEWLRGPLKAWADDLFHDKTTIIGELVDLQAVRSIWREHLERGMDHSYRLWVILVLVSWARTWQPV